MSKQDKDTQAGPVSTASADYAVQPESTAAEVEQDKAERSRLFNAWLDRAVPLLHQYLSNGNTTTAVTSAGSKPKH